MGVVWIAWCGFLEDMAEERDSGFGVLRFHRCGVEGVGCQTVGRHGRSRVLNFLEDMAKVD